MAVSVSESLGDVETPVGVLRCTLGAFENVNVLLNSFGEAYRRVAQMDALAITIIVAEGQGKKVADVKDAVWRIGAQKLVEPVTKYLTMLSNGGKMPDETSPQSGEV